MFVPFIAFGPEQVMALLNKKKMKGVTFMGMGGTPSFKGTQHLVIFSFADVESHMPLLRVMSSKYDIYIFGNMFDMERWGLTPVDVGLSSIEELNLKNLPAQRLRRVPKDNMVEHVLEHVRKHSLFGALMSVIYKLPSKASQPAATTLCCKWLVGNDPLDVLAEDLRSATKKRDEIRLEILKVMSAPIASRLRSALREVNGNDDSEFITTLARNHRVPAYEISYVLGHLNKKRAAIDQYVANVGEED